MKEVGLKILTRVIGVVLLITTALPLVLVGTIPTLLNITCSGEVVAIKTSVISRDNNDTTNSGMHPVMGVSYTYAGIYSFYVNGKEYRVVAGDCVSPERLKESITVFYNPKYPAINCKSKYPFYSLICLPLGIPMLLYCIRIIIKGKE